MRIKDCIELSKETVNAFQSAKIRAYSSACGGACGEPGALIILTEDGAAYHYNDGTSDLPRTEVKLDFIGERAYENLGLGNILFYHAEDDEWLHARVIEFMESSTESCARWKTTTLYNHWVDFFRERYNG